MKLRHVMPGAVVLLSCGLESRDAERVFERSAAVVTTCGGSAIPANTTWQQPGYAWYQKRTWLLKGDGLTPSDSLVELQFTEPPGITGVHVNWHCVRGYLRDSSGSITYIGTSAVTTGTASCGSGTCLRKVEFDVGTSQRAAGDYDLLLAADDQQITFAHRKIRISAPLYLVISTDWDYPTYAACSGGQTILQGMDALRQNRPAGFAFSHFVGAYMWTGEQGTARSSAVEQWLLCRSGRLPSSATCVPPSTPDEIGVHVHAHETELLNQVPLPSCCPSSCASSSSITTNCSTASPCAAPSICPHVNPRQAAGETWANNAYSTYFRAFAQEEMSEILDYSSRVLVRHGFLQPTSFRAGGWAAGPNVLQAMQSTVRYGMNGGSLVALGGQGYTVDSSSVPPASVCDEAAVLCPSLQSPAGLSATTTPSSQPYTAGTVLEVPDNGALIDYRKSTDGAIAADLAAVFSGSPLATPRLYQFGFHPHNWCTRGAEVQAALDNDVALVTHGDGALDRGPGVWTTISRLRQSTIAGP